MYVIDLGMPSSLEMLISGFPARQYRAPPKSQALQNFLVDRAKSKRERRDAKRLRDAKRMGLLPKT